VRSFYSTICTTLSPARLRPGERKGEDKELVGAESGVARFAVDAVIEIAARLVPEDLAEQLSPVEG
jgi:hypothetical protein